MKPMVGAIHELPLPQVMAIILVTHHTCIQQCLLQFYHTPLHGLVEPLQIVVEALRSQTTWDAMLHKIPDIS
jgi:hypothetical protein